MIELDGVRVSSTLHATDQALKRVELLRGASRSGAAHWVERTAAKAILDGRSARTMPRWCSVGKTRLPKRSKLTPKKGVSRFVWNETETAVLMVTRSHDRDHEVGAGWVVLTVMTPRTSAEAA